MDILVLDDNLVAREFVNEYESFIWTERYSDIGDFELKIKSDRGTRELLKVGTNLGIRESYRVMTVETSEDGISSDGVAILTLKGRSMERYLDKRGTRPVTWVPYKSNPWKISYTPKVALEHVFAYACGDLGNTVDLFPYYDSGPYLPAGNIPLPDTVLDLTVEPKSLYSWTKEIADAWELGFRVVKNPTTNLLHYDVYTGNDRTTAQTTYPAVVFAPELENLSNTTEIRSVASQNTVAYVYGVNANAIVYSDGYSDSSVGLDRQVITVLADDIDLPVGAALTAALVQKGHEELAKHRALIGFDGEVPETGTYRYGTDYGLGDLVEVRNSDGLTTNMMVTEQIFVSDPEGDRAYPTFITHTVVTPGSWYAWSSGQVWDDADEYWDTA